MFKNFKKLFLDLIFPSFCVSCGKDGSYLCKKCVNNVQIKSNSLELNKSAYLKGVISATNYQNKTIQKAIKIFKYQFSEELGKSLAEVIRKKLIQCMKLSKKFIFIPVPLHKKRYKWRGFNQSELLSIYLAEKYKTLSVNLLKKIKHTKAQAKLSKKARLQNLKNAFSIQDVDIEIPKTTRIFIIDDVVTTGTTLNECAKILYKNGYKNIYGLTICG